MMQPGDSLIGLAHRFRRRDPHAIFHHPDNAELRARRDDPDVLAPGDVVVIPDAEAQPTSCATGGAHRFVAQGPRAVVRLVLREFDGTPLAHARYRLWVRGRACDGTTDGSGVLEERVPANAREALLVFGGCDEHHRDACALRLDLGALVPCESVRGVQARLKNLGFYAGPDDGVENEATCAAVAAFRAAHRLGPGGIDADLRRSVKEKSGR